MKWVTYCLISCCGILFAACVDESREKEPLPEIAILEQVQQVRWDKQELEELIRSATFLNSTTAAHNLLSHLQQVESFSERRAITEVLTRMTCDPEGMIIERLHAEENPEQKGKLIPVLMNFQSAQGVLLLVDHLDDTRRADFETYPQEQPAYPARVCDIAYNFLIWKLLGLGIIERQQFPYPSYGAYEGQDQLIAEFKTYWEQNKASLLKRIQEKTRATPTPSPTK